VPAAAQQTLKKEKRKRVRQGPKWRRISISSGNNIDGE